MCIVWLFDNNAHINGDSIFLLWSIELYFVQSILVADFECCILSGLSCRSDICLLISHQTVNQLYILELCLILKHSNLLTMITAQGQTHQIMFHQIKNWLRTISFNRARSWNWNIVDESYINSIGRYNYIGLPVILPQVLSMHPTSLCQQSPSFQVSWCCFGL